MSLRVAIFSSHARRGFAAALAWQLTRDGHTVVAILVKRAPHWRRGRRPLRRSARHVLASWLQRGLGRAGAESSLAAYAQAHGVPQSLPALARRVGATWVRCDSFASPAALLALRTQAVDLGLHTGDGPLRPAVLELCGRGVARCHTGALPQMRGSDGLAWSALLGVPLELTCQWLSTGAVLSRCPVPAVVGDTLEELRARLEPLRVEALRDLARALRSGPRQEEPLDSRAGREHYPMHPRLLTLAAARFK